MTQSTKNVRKIGKLLGTLTNGEAVNVAIALLAALPDDLVGAIVNTDYAARQKRDANKIVNGAEIPLSEEGVYNL